MRMIFMKHRRLSFLILFISLYLLVNIPLAYPDTKIDINTATKQELQTISGIGPTIAQKIVELRREKGGFKNFDQLLEIKGIGKERLSRIRLCATISIIKEGEEIPKEKEPISESNKLNINQASRSDFEVLPGIGPKLAGNIIAYRTYKKGFKSTQEMLYVKGIGPRKFERIKDLITTESCPEE